MSKIRSKIYHGTKKKVANAYQKRSYKSTSLDILSQNDYQNHTEIYSIDSPSLQNQSIISGTKRRGRYISFHVQQRLTQKKFHVNHKY